MTYNEFVLLATMPVTVTPRHWLSSQPLSVGDLQMILTDWGFPIVHEQFEC